MSEKKKEDFWEKKFKDKLREKHDRCKEHPFWRTLTNDFHTDCVELLMDMMESLINYHSDDLENCPHASLIYPTMHNMCDVMLKSKIMPKYYHTTVMETKCFGNYIMCLQTALQIVHYYLDGIFDEDSMVAYDPYFKFDEETEQYVECTYKTYGVRSNEDGTYRSVRIITKDEVDNLIEWHTNAAIEYAKLTKYFAEHGQKAYAESNLKIAQYHESCVNDLKDNKEKHFVIKKI